MNGKSNGIRPIKLCASSIPSEFEFSVPEKNEDDYYVSRVSRQHMPACFETPYLSVLAAHEEDGSVELSVDDELYKTLRAIDNYIVQSAFDCRKLWFGKNLGLPKIEKFYKSPLNPEQQVMRCHLNGDGDKIYTSFFHDCELLDKPHLAIGASVKLILQLKEICMSKTSMVPIWIIHSVKFPTHQAKKEVVSNLDQRRSRLKNLI